MTTGIVWFRRDLRLTDNPALSRALAECDQLVPVYIHDPDAEAPWQMGAASRWWLHHSLQALADALQRRGSRLVIRHGGSLEQLRRLASDCSASAVYWNRLYEPALVARDRAVKQELRERGCSVASCAAALLREPWEVTHDGGQPYRVFTPFWKALQQRGWDGNPLPAPPTLGTVRADLAGLNVGDLGLLPRIRWDDGFREHWEAGEEAALTRLERFLESRLAAYPGARDLPHQRGTSELSPHLHFGEIGPRQIAAALAHRQAMEDGAAGQAGADAWLRELGWREFAHHLLFHFPETPDAALNRRFDDFPWAEPEPALLAAWQRGRTGIPLVDAGMRQLWRTGWMHNRVRMVVASFLTKNLRLSWLEGARWFWDTLVDADLANNTLGWQWSAGCGADAAPYYRIFNPVLQGERFDPDGTYVRRWIPELDRLPDRYLHRPWSAPADVLRDSQVELGVTYPRPIVDLKASRDGALAAYQHWRQDGGRE